MIGNITDTDSYKLNIKLSEFRPNEYHLEISKYITEHGWISHSYFLSKEELKKVQKAVLGD